MDLEYCQLPPEAPEGRMDLALMALREAVQSGSTIAMTRIWMRVPLQLRDGVLRELISSSDTMDYRIIYALDQVTYTRTLCDRQDSLQGEQGIISMIAAMADLLA